MHITKTSKFTGFGDIRGRPKPYKFIGFGNIHGPKPYKFIGFGGRARPVFLPMLADDSTKAEAAALPQQVRPALRPCRVHAKANTGTPI